MGGIAVAMEESTVVTPGEVLGKASELKAGKGAYISQHNNTVYASLTGLVSLIPSPPNSTDQVTYYLSTSLLTLYLFRKGFIVFVAFSLKSYYYVIMNGVFYCL